MHTHTHFTASLLGSQFCTIARRCNTKDPYINTWVKMTQNTRDKTRFRAHVRMRIVTEKNARLLVTSVW